MMKVAGLLPINFRGVQYNIPVCVWVPQQYPTMPPIPYVQPTPDMDVVRGHQHVGADGMCYFPYCNQWTMHANVSGLLDVMVAAFSAHPPVTAKLPEAEARRVEEERHGAPAPARAPGSPQYFPRARSPPRRVRGEYRAGDRVEYHSVSSSTSISLASGLSE
jgi:ESCRT-I complex subunit TSG101